MSTKILINLIKSGYSINFEPNQEEKCAVIRLRKGNKSVIKKISYDALGSCEENARFLLSVCMYEAQRELSRVYGVREVDYKGWEEMHNGD